MIYTKMTRKAMDIAYRAHHGQVDKSGVPYIFHPMHLAEQMDDEDSVCVALLHDVIEDTRLTLENLISEGFDTEVIEALRVLTHSQGTPYMTYIENIAKNALARKVKLVDLKHNSDITRLDKLRDADLERIDKYRNALEYLKQF